MHTCVTYNITYVIGCISVNIYTHTHIYKGFQVMLVVKTTSQAGDIKDMSPVFPGQGRSP